MKKIKFGTPFILFVSLFLAIDTANAQRPAATAARCPAQCPAGPAGATGLAGATGPAGVAGPIGPSGPAGSDGSIGPAGPAGETGPVGLTGATGATGPTGSLGATCTEGGCPLDTIYGVSVTASTARCLVGSDASLCGDPLVSALSSYPFAVRPDCGTNDSAVVLRGASGNDPSNAYSAGNRVNTYEYFYKLEDNSYSRCSPGNLSNLPPGSFDCEVKIVAACFRSSTYASPTPPAPTSP